MQKSTDNGSTWSDGIGVGFNEPKNQDKEWLAADHTNSQFKNNIYMAWTEFDNYGSERGKDKSRILFSYSEDAGEIWSNPVKVSDVEGDCIDEDETVEGAVPTVGPNGEIYVSWAGPLGLMFDKSLDGGKTFGTDIFVSDIPGGWDFGIPGINRCNGMPITACDISNSEYRGNIYIGWSDQRNGTDNTDIFFKKSTDKGNTWSELIKVNSDTTSRHQFFTWMTVDSTSGNIYFVFYDRRNTIYNETEVYIARSVDGGETFQNYKISESSFTPNSGVFFGDYINIAVYNGEIRPIWMRMDNNKLSIWTAKITDADLDLTSVESDKLEIADYHLYQNYPNPFNPSTRINYSIPVMNVNFASQKDNTSVVTSRDFSQRTFNGTLQHVTLKVYDILGNEIATLVDKGQKAGNYEVEFNASSSTATSSVSSVSARHLSSGVYFYRITTPYFTETKKMILLR